MAPRVPFQVPYPFVDGLDTQPRDQLYRNFEEVGGLFVPQTSYIPGTTPGSTANFGITVGNGTETASYYRVGQLVHMSYHLVWGSTTSFGAEPGAVAVGLPIPGKLDGQPRPSATCWFRDVAPSQSHYTGGGLLVDLDSDGNLIRFRPQVPITPGDKSGQWTRSAAQSVASNSATFIVWDTESADRDGILSPPSDTFTLNTPGIYTVTTFVGFGTRNDWIRAQIGIQATSGTWHALSEWIGHTSANTVATQNLFLQTSGTVLVGTPRSLRVRVFQVNQGGVTVSTTTGTTTSLLQVTRIGDNVSNIPLNVNALNPFRWTTGDIFSCGVTYEVADGY